MTVADLTSGRVQQDNALANTLTDGLKALTINCSFIKPSAFLFTQSQVHNDRFKLSYWPLFLPKLTTSYVELTLQNPIASSKVPAKAHPSPSRSRSTRALLASQRLMNPPSISSPKCKFSSRNLNAVFKAPIGTKPLPENATVPLQRSTYHMLVLRKVSVEPPAPLNTLSLKSKSQVLVNLVPAGSSWAKNAEKFVQNQAVEHSTDAVTVAAYTEVSEKVWTPESVAEYLHTSSVIAPPKATVKNSGRWGDDAVEDDIVQNNIRRQIQREREFPDLKKALEETRGHVSAAGEIQSMGSLQEPEQRHGRATGRWAHFNKEKMHHSMQETGSRWSHIQYEDDRWSRDQSRCDYGLENRRHEVTSNVGLPDPIDCHVHFSRSDVRFDIVASSGISRSLGHSPHSMEWGNAPVSHQVASLSSASPNEASCVNTLQPLRSWSSPVVPVTSSTAVEMISSKEDYEPEYARDNDHRTNTEWPENEESSALVTEEMQSSTKSSSNSLSRSSPSPPQQVQLLKRPKTLFDPKTGGLLNAEDMTRPGKRQTGERNGDKDRNVASISTSSGSIRASKRTNFKREVQAKAPTSKSKSGRAGRKEANLTPDIVDAGTSASQIAIVANEQESVVKGVMCTSETLSTTSEQTASQADIKVASKGKRVNKDSKRVTKPLTTRPKQQHRNKSRYDTVVSVRGSLTSSSGKATDRIKRNIPMQCNGREPRSNKYAQLTDEQQVIEANPEDGGFEMVKSRRAVLFEKKQLREQVIAAMAVAPLLDDKKCERASLEEHADVHSKQIDESFGMANASTRDAQPTFRLREKAANFRRNANEVTKDKKTKRLPKETTGTRGSKKKEMSMKAKVPVGGSHTEMPEHVALRSIEQVAGEAPTEAALLKKSTKGFKAAVKLKKDKQSDEAYKANAGIRCSSVAGTTRKQEQRKRQGTKQSAHKGVQSEGSAATKLRGPGGITAKWKAKQVRQVYVVKTLAPAPARAAFSAV